MSEVTQIPQPETQAEETTGVSVLTLQMEELEGQMKELMRQLLLAEKQLTKLAKQMQDIEQQRSQIREQVNFLSGQLSMLQKLFPQDKLQEIQQRLYEEIQKELQPQEQ